ncbi:MAG: hypothetical protein HXY52_07125 [Nitrospirae bacterium]|jgi:CO dehydrogenase/acetyl-CoA synthase gamma subunit (corrinoid Fe-S protein)|nr:hypothetical protein [Nitrospirota bacterium]
MSSADLYINSIDIKKYLDESECLKCGFSSCNDFIESVKEGKANIEECKFIGKNRLNAFKALKKIEINWPEVPLITFPRPAYTGLIELNNPDEKSIILITGNNEFTEQVVLTVLGTTACPFYVLFVDTDGNTIDMSMIYNTFNAERVLDALEKTGLLNVSSEKNIIIPGLAHSIENEIKKLTRFNVKTGPVCVAELPLLLSDIWIPP